MEHALEVVPKHEVENTPIFLLATAGMRLLPDNERNAVLDNVCAYFQDNTRFQLPDCNLHIQVIPGETEGLYGWVAANYLLGGFDSPDRNDHGKDHHTYGFLDMGGASAQIAFAPNATEADKHANDLKLLRMRKVNGDAVEYKVFVTTWLGFGANEARRRYVVSLFDAYPGNRELPDPCLPRGFFASNLGPNKVHLLGTGNFEECLRRTYPLLDKHKPCEDAPCLLNGVHTPAIDFDVNHFVGVSEYWYTTHEVFAMAHKDKAYDFHTYQKQVTDFCKQDWKTIMKGVKSEKWGRKVDEKTVAEVCFKASWLINMLHDGIGVPREGLDKMPAVGDGHSNKTKAMLDKAKDRGFLDPFQAVDKIEGTEVSWTLGKMVLYASSQMPSAIDGLDVGFGSNTPGMDLPNDFQYAGGKPVALPNDLSDADDHAGLDDDLDWHDKIFSSSSSRRAPGIVLFLVILTLAVYLLCGRDRRLSMWHRILSLAGRRPGTPRSKRRKAPGITGNKLFGNSSGPNYERVLEDGDPAEFELADVPSEEENSDSSTSSHPPRTGRTSGWATPALNRGMSPDITRSSPKGKGYFDGATTPGNGLGITPFDQSGLIVRTESKERLAPHRSKSRAGSPTRRSPLMTPFKENVD